MTHDRGPSAPTVVHRPGTALLAPPEWLALRARHHARVDALTADHLRRQRQGEPHPVEDFLFSYYSYRPGQLRQWRPGVGRALLGAGDLAGWRFHTLSEGALGLDRTAYLQERGATVRFVRDLLVVTASRRPHLGCFGLHEWAMVYRQEPSSQRHARWPLRLGQAGTDEVVDRHRLTCTHFDAYRFFTAPARPLNEAVPRADTRLSLEQPGCLHATMDLYKHAFRLAPAVPSELTADCFELAREVRVLDMRASPYDLRGLGLEPVPVETPGGKAEYAAAQRGFVARAAVLRQRLMDLCEVLLSAPAPGGAADRR